MLVGPRPAVHIIGGIGNLINGNQILDFISAARSTGADGISIYDINSMPVRYWNLLQRGNRVGL
jgi:hypothetical protein